MSNFQIFQQKLKQFSEKKLHITELEHVLKVAQEVEDDQRSYDSIRKHKAFHRDKIQLFDETLQQLDNNAKKIAIRIENASESETIDDERFLEEKRRKLEQSRDLYFSRFTVVQQILAEVQELKEKLNTIAEPRESESSLAEYQKLQVRLVSKRAEVAALRAAKQRMESQREEIGHTAYMSNLKGDSQLEKLRTKNENLKQEWTGYKLRLFDFVQKHIAQLHHDLPEHIGSVQSLPDAELAMAEEITPYLYRSTLARSVFEYPNTERSPFTDVNLAAVYRLLGISPFVEVTNITGHISQNTSEVEVEARKCLDKLQELKPAQVQSLANIQGDLEDKETLVKALAEWKEQKGQFAAHWIKVENANLATWLKHWRMETLRKKYS